MNTKSEQLEITDEDFETSSKSCNTNSRVSVKELNSVIYQKINAQNTEMGGVNDEISPKDMRKRGFAFTDFNNKIEMRKGVKYILWGNETCPTTGRLHRQGLILFKDGKTETAVRKMFPGTHIKFFKSKKPKESEQSKLVKNARYCIKDGEWEELGERPATLNKIFRETDVTQSADWRLSYLTNNDIEISPILTWNQVQSKMAFWKRTLSYALKIWMPRPVEWNELIISKNDEIYAHYKLDGYSLIKC